MSARTVLCGFADPDFPFINFMRHTGSAGAALGYAYQALLGFDGYPTATPTNTIGARIFTGLDRTGYAGNWVVKWSGTGRFTLSSGPTGIVLNATGSVISQTGATATLGGTDGRAVLQPSVPITNIDILFSANVGTFSGFNGLVFCREDHEALHDAGEIFNPDFVAKLQAINPGVIRTLGWSAPNDGNILSKHDYRAPADYLNLGGWVPNAWVTGNTISGTDTYTVTGYPDMPAQWTDGETFQGIVTNANTGAATIDVGSRGAKTVCNAAGSALGANAIKANTSCTFIYSAVYDKVVVNPGTSDGKGGGLTRRYPIETQIALCNKIGCDFWYPMNHLMNDESVTALVTLVRGTLSPGLRFFLELSNEIWNFGAGYPQTSFFNSIGSKIGFPNANNEWFHGAYAKRVREIHYLATQAWSPRSTSELRRVIAFQGAGDDPQIKKYRLEGFDLGSTGTPGNIGGGTYGCPAGSNFGAVGQRPIDYADVLSYGTYYSGVNAENFDANWTLTKVQTVGAKADDYASGDTALMDAALDWLDTDLRTGLTGETLERVDGYHTNHNPTAATYGLPILIYEGALEINPPSTSKLTSLGADTAYYATIKAFFDAYKRDFRCYKLIRDQYSQFMAYSQAEAPAWFWMSDGSQWSMFETSLYGQAYASYDAVRHYNNGVKRFRVT